MDMVLRTLVAMGKILHIMLNMFLYMVVDTIGDTERLGGFVNQILDVASSEIEVNPLFAGVFMILMLGLTWFVISQVKGSIQSIVIMLIIAGVIFLIIFTLGV